MALYKRGDVWWFKFRFEGQVIRESAKTSSKTIARDAERARRHDLELAVNRIQKRDRMPLFKIAAEEWLATKAALTPLSAESITHSISASSWHTSERVSSRTSRSVMLRDYSENA